MNLINLEGHNGNNEWHTPAVWMDRVRAVLGTIDLDPASCEMANRTVQATRYFSIDENGLAQDWSWAHTIFLNPPYLKIRHNVSSLGLWIRKFFAEYEKPGSQIEQAIILSTSDPDERWYEPLWPYHSCFTVPRVTFNRPGKKPERQSFGTAFTYIGPDEDRFVEVFRQCGPIYKTVTIPDKPSCPVQSVDWTLAAS